MKKTAAAISSLALVLSWWGVASADPALPSPWPQEHFDAAHTGVNRFETTLSPANVSQLAPLWVSDTGIQIEASPVISHGVLFSAGSTIPESQSSYAFALDTATGK